MKNNDSKKEINHKNKKSTSKLVNEYMRKSLLLFSGKGIVDTRIILK